MAPISQRGVVALRVRSVGVDDLDVGILYLREATDEDLELIGVGRGRLDTLKALRRMSRRPRGPVEVVPPADGRSHEPALGAWTYRADEPSAAVPAGAHEPLAP